MQEASMNSGIAFICDHNGIVLNVYRDDFSIFGTLSGKEHLSHYITAGSNEAVTRFFSMLSSEGLSASRPIEFLTLGASKPLFCTGMRLQNCFLIVGAATLFDLGALIPAILYVNEVPVEFSPICRSGTSTESKILPDYKVYEDLTRLNNELVNMSRELSDTQVELEMEADELNKEIQVRIRAEQALSVAIKKLNLLSSITRHDINNQLTVLMGFLTLLKKKQPDPALNDYFVKVSNAAQRISSMIQFTSEYEKIGVNAPLWQDCSTVVDTAVKQTPLEKVVVKNDLTPGTEVFADPLIVKVFYNLMDNAVRYGGKITTIRFSVEESGEDHIIVCEDDGVGVVAEEKLKIFERGFGKNTGMGLFLTVEILSITGITIRETGKPGKGARFEIIVPNGAWQTTKKGI
jgi:signal transduction histidine kinase